MKKNLIKDIIPFAMLILSCTSKQEKNMQSLQLIDELIKKIEPSNKILIPIEGDIILFKKTKTNELTHAAIYSKKFSAENHKVIGSVLSGIHITDLKGFSTRNLCDYNIYRFDQKKLCQYEKNKIRKVIARQSEVWYEKIIATSKNTYRHKDFYYYLALKHSNDYKETQAISNVLASYKNFDEAIMLNNLQYLKYSLRQNIIPTLNSGFTCAGFVLACIGNSFINEITQEYSIKNINTEWPSLKYGQIDTDNLKFKKVVDLLNQETTQYNVENYKKYLLKEHPNLDVDNLSSLFILPEKQRVKKISLFTYLKNKQLSTEKVLNEISIQLKELNNLNIRMSTLEDIQRYLISNPYQWSKIK